jgi:hypothetical protein
MNSQICAVVLVSVLSSLGFAILLAALIGNTVAALPAISRTVLAFCATFLGAALTMGLAVALWRVTIVDPGIGGALFSAAAGLIAAPAYGILTAFGPSRLGLWLSIAIVAAGTLLLMFASWPLES